MKTELPAPPGVDPIRPMTVAEIATGEHRRTLKRAARRGELEIIELSPKRHGIKQSQLDAYIAKKERVR